MGNFVRLYIIDIWCVGVGSISQQEKVHSVVVFERLHRPSSQRSVHLGNGIGRRTPNRSRDFND